MEISVLIPTYQRPAKLGACLRALAAQTLDSGSYEVLVGIDGPDSESEAAARSAWGSCAAGLVVRQCPRSGYNAVRNAMLDLASGKYLVSLNDDVVPDRTFLETHLAAQREAEARGGPAVVSGHSPWKTWPNPSLFDAIVAESSLIFFFDQMNSARVAELGPWHDWGFRHCYGLNFSAPLRLIRDSGKFTAFHLAYGYDDIEIAFRLKHAYGTPVLYRPAAVAVHDHRYRPDEVLAREFKLGHSAWHFAERTPSFCEAVFGRDIRSKDELQYSREFIQRERSLAGMVMETWLSLGSIPAGALSGDHAKALLRMTYLHLLPLKRWMWRAGLVAAAEDRPQGAIVYPKN